MRPSKNITVLTAIKNPGIEIELTFNSLKNLVDELGNNVVRWIIADGGERAVSSDSISHWGQHLREVIYKHEDDHGIYDAINKCLKLVGTEPFIIIHSGDTLKTDILDVIPTVDKLVVCGVATWHDSSGRELSKRRDKNYNFNLAIMPNHQAMIFPGSDSQSEYNTAFAVASDLDLKLNLARNLRLTFIPQEIASCLEGGISDRRMSLKTAFDRGIETCRILLRHYPLPHALILAVMYQLSFLIRINFKIFR